MSTDVQHREPGARGRFCRPQAWRPGRILQVHHGASAVEMPSPNPGFTRAVQPRHDGPLNSPTGWGNTASGRGVVGVKSAPSRASVGPPPAPPIPEIPGRRSHLPPKHGERHIGGVAELVSRSRIGPSSQGRPEARHLAFVRSFAACRGGGKGRRHRLLGRVHAEPVTASGPMRWLTGNSHQGSRRTREGCVGGRRR